MTNAEPETVKHFPYRKKWCVFDEMSASCMETDVEGYPTISHACKLAGGQGGNIESAIRPPVLHVPYTEFRELVFYIPEFKNLPILENAWRSAGEPTKFIAQCFDTCPNGRPDGDTLLVDTQGYDYARYKAPLFECLV
jgi:hypothetical protein|tara:strand:- start:13 stop:426 length:414 start_codon:yes stop_codon:yes gene_type:complete